MKAYKYRCYPTASQREQLKNQFGCNRFVYNQLLRDNIDAYQSYLDSPDSTEYPDTGEVGLTNAVSKLRNNVYPTYAKDGTRIDTTFLKAVGSNGLQQTARDLSKAFTNFFNQPSKGFPKPKNKYSKQSCRFNGKTSSFLKGDGIHLPKCKRALRVRWHRPLPEGAVVQSYTISMERDGKYYVSIILKGEYNDQVLTNGQGTIGLDLGIKDLAIDSNGVKYDNPKHYLVALTKLANKQARFSKMAEDDDKREKVKRSVARLHRKVTNQRRDYLHKLSRQLINENQVIGVETLKVTQMMSNFKAVNRILMTTGLPEFIRMLKYKAEDSGHVKVIPAVWWFPSTHLCSTCGDRRTTKLKLTERKWTCPACNTTHDRDINAAINIRNYAVKYIKDNPGEMPDKPIIFN